MVFRSFTCAACVRDYMTGKFFGAIFRIVSSGAVDSFVQFSFFFFFFFKFGAWFYACHLYAGGWKLRKCTRSSSKFERIIIVKMSERYNRREVRVICVAGYFWKERIRSSEGALEIPPYGQKLSVLKKKNGAPQLGNYIGVNGVRWT